jgi:hypothetical protein
MWCLEQVSSPPLRGFNAALSPDQLPRRLRGAADGNRTHVCAPATHGSAIELRTLDRVGAQSRTRTCGARRHLIYSQASLPLEYLCVFVCVCLCELARTTLQTPAPRCWWKVDGSNATPCGAHPFSRRVAGRSSGTFLLDVSARFERATSAFGQRRSVPLSYETTLSLGGSSGRQAKVGSRARMSVLTRGTHRPSTGT